MAEKDEGKKPRYETPIVVPLGEMAKGAGACQPLGSSDIALCAVGTVATDNCLAGTDVF